jgi:hypothetical protein
VRRWLLVPLALGALGLAIVLWVSHEPPAASLPSSSSLPGSLDPTPRLHEQAAALTGASARQADTSVPPPRLAPEEPLQQRKLRLQALREALGQKEGWKGTNMAERVRRMREPLTPNTSQ